MIISIQSKLIFECLSFGKLDFNKTRLPPPGTKIRIHVEPQNRDSWSFHGEEGWYIGRSMEHHGCITCYILSTFKARFINTTTLILNTIPITTSALEEHITKSDIIFNLNMK